MESPDHLLPAVLLIGRSGGRADTWVQATLRALAGRGGRCWIEPSPDAHQPAVTEIAEIPDRGHPLTIDGGWRDVADTALWLVQRLTRGAAR